MKNLNIEQFNVQELNKQEMMDIYGGCLTFFSFSWGSASGFHGSFLWWRW